MTRVCVQLYDGDLESEFNQFQDWLKTFPLYKGRAISDDDDDDDQDRQMGKYKVKLKGLCVLVHPLVFLCSLLHHFRLQGSFLVYPIDPEDKEDLVCQITNGIPKNSPVKVLVRVYIVKVPACRSLTL